MSVKVILQFPVISVLYKRSISQILLSEITPLMISATFRNSYFYALNYFCWNFLVLNWKWILWNLISSLMAYSQICLRNISSKIIILAPGDPRHTCNIPLCFLWKSHWPQNVNLVGVFGQHPCDFQSPLHSKGVSLMVIYELSLCASLIWPWMWVILTSFLLPPQICITLSWVMVDGP